MPWRGSRFSACRIGLSPFRCSQSTRLFLVEQVREGQRPEAPGIPAQEGTTIQTKKRVVHVRDRGHRDRNSIDIEEGIAGKEHLAEICPGVMLWAPASAFRGSASAGLRRNRRVAMQLIRSRRSVDDQLEGPRRCGQSSSPGLRARTCSRDRAARRASARAS